MHPGYVCVGAGGGGGGGGLNFVCYIVQQNFNGSNPDGSFTMDESNTFLSPQVFPPNTICG